MAVWQYLWVRYRHCGELQRGQGMLEYGLILVLVGILLIVSLTLFSDEISGLYGLIIERLDSVIAS